MEKLNEKALNYATEKSNQIVNAAIAQAYIDGYRDGYKDREEEIPVDLRDKKTEYVDLGLPSGTLWSKNYEMFGCDISYLTYDKACTYSIPTEEQCNELIRCCQWSVSKVQYNTIFNCLGPNGNYLCFMPTGHIELENKVSPGVAYFWHIDTANETAIEDFLQGGHNTFRIDFDGGKIRSQLVREFRGLKLPIRLVKK